MYPVGCVLSSFSVETNGGRNAGKRGSRGGGNLVTVGDRYILYRARSAPPPQEDGENIHRGQGFLRLALDVVPQHQFLGVWIEVGLHIQVRIREPPEVVLEECNGDNQGNHSV